jgi:hypothetical protein
MPAARAQAPTETVIREKAYYLWEQDGRPHGRDQEFWERATALLATVGPTRTKSAASAAATKPASVATKPAPTEAKPAKRATKAKA